MKNVFEVIPNLITCVEKLEEIKKFTVANNSVAYTAQDARLVAFDSMQLTISGNIMWFNCYHSLAEYNAVGNVLNEADFLKKVRSNLDYHTTEGIMFDELRMGFMTQIHFKIDNLFSNILKHLNKLPAQRGYWNLTDAILVECGIPKVGIEKDVLTAFANLRNSLHGNGMHRTQTLSVAVGGLQYDFVKDTKVECASWQHIVTLLDANIEIIKKIVETLNINGIIIDDFASIPI